MTEMKSTTIMQYKVVEESLPDLIELTGLPEEKWRVIMQNGSKFGIQNHAFIIPSEVRWKLLLAKYMLHVGDVEGSYFIDSENYDVPPLTEEDRALLSQLLEEHRPKED
jgi:hypothetical protein